MWDEREQQKIDAIWRLPKGLVILILTFAVVALIVPMYVHTRVTCVIQLRNTVAPILDQCCTSWRGTGRF